LPVNKDERAALSEHAVVDLEPELSSYAHTGALLKQLDLVIGVDTSVVHLAAALAVPTWIILAAHSDWRWLEQRNDTPWYPGVMLCRQSVPDDWSELISRVQQVLS
jgi:ADP-heptose:LPS heptosyltransferase